MSLTISSSQFFFPWGATELKICDLAPRPDLKRVMRVFPASLFLVSNDLMP